MKIMFLVLALFAFAVMALEPTNGAIRGEYEYNIEKVIGSPLPDTLASSDDSTRLLTKYHFIQGFSYIYVQGPLAGTAFTGHDTDSCVIQVRFDYYDQSQNFLYSVNVDTITLTGAKTGRNIMLPVCRTGYSYYGSIVLKPITGHSTTGTVIFRANRSQIERRRVILTEKDWQ